MICLLLARRLPNSIIIKFLPIWNVFFQNISKDMQQESIQSNCPFLWKRQNSNTLYFYLLFIVLSKLGYPNELIGVSWSVISWHKSRVPTKCSLVKNGIFAKMATKVACLLKNGLFGQKWPFQSFHKVCLVGALYAWCEMSEDM